MIANRLKKFFVAMCALAIVCSINHCSAEKKIVAIMPLENVSGYDEEKVAEIMTEQLIVALHSSRAYTAKKKTVKAFASAVNFFVVLKNF